MLPGPQSDGQFYSPPESVAGQFPCQGGVSDLPLPVSHHQLRLNGRCELVRGWKSCYTKVIFFSLFRRHRVLCSSDSDEELDDKHDPEKGLIQRLT